jgi:predicted Fe-Mo cluster-binding NifX family protein
MKQRCQVSIEQDPSAGDPKPAGEWDSASRMSHPVMLSRSTGVGGAGYPVAVVGASAAVEGGTDSGSFTSRTLSNCTGHPMILGIANDGDQVSEHFGHCKGYSIYRIQNGEIVEKRTIENPGHEPGRLPKLLAELGVEVVIAGGMGPKAADLFCAQGIDVYTGVSGPVDDVAQKFIRGELVQGENVCHH